MTMELLSSAEKVHKNKKYKKALELYKQVLVFDSGNLKALLGLADCFYNLSKNPIYAQQAIEVSNKIIKISPQFAKPYVILSYIERDINKSSEYAEKALNLEPNSEEALCCYGVLMLRQEKSSEAIIYLEKAIQIFPEMYLAHYNLLVAYYNLRDIKSQLVQSKILLRLKPNLRNLTRFLSTYLAINRLLYLVLIMTPLLYIWFPKNFLFTPHFLLIYLYINSIVSGIKFKFIHNIKRNILSILLILLVDLMLLISYY